MNRIYPGSLEDFLRITFSDVMLILVILSATAGFIVVAKYGAPGASSSVFEASVVQAGNVTKTLGLERDQDIILSNGGICLEIKNKKIRIKKSSCNHQTCVHMGWIHYPGEAIVCIPNNLLIRIESSDSQAVDAVIY